MNLTEFFVKKSTWYFIGIKGSGMSSLAEILRSEFDQIILGSDLLITEINQFQINNNHDPNNITNNIDVIIRSSAIKNNNPEFVRAKELKIPIFHRSELLNYLISLHQIRIGIMGTHGKGTTTGAIGMSNNENNFIVGGIVENHNSSFRFNKKNKVIVAEIDESDGSFLNYKLDLLLINNLSLDHMDYYQNLDNLINKISDYILNSYTIKTIFINISDVGTMKLYLKLKKNSNKKIFTFGKVEVADFFYQINQLRDPTKPNSQSIFKVNHELFTTNLLAEFNISNLTGAISVLKYLKQTINLESYYGIKNRCQVSYTFNNVCCTQVYAHHPLEFKLVSSAFIKKNRKTIIIYEPFGSEIFMSNIFNLFTDCFYKKNLVIMKPYYLNSELYNTKTLFDKIKNKNKILLKSNQDIYQYIIDNYKSDTSFLFFGVPNKFKKRMY